MKPPVPAAPACRKPSRCRPRCWRSWSTWRVRRPSSVAGSSSRSAISAIRSTTWRAPSNGYATSCGAWTWKPRPRSCPATRKRSNRVTRISTRWRWTATRSCNSCPDRCSSRHRIRCRLEQRSGQLLQLRVAVHLQRVEILVTLFDLFLVAGQDLGLGFHVQAPQLVAYPFDGALHVVERMADIADLLLDPATEDGRLTRQVDQLLQQRGRHLDGFLHAGAAGTGGFIPAYAHGVAQDLPHIGQGASRGGGIRGSHGRTGRARRRYRQFPADLLDALTLRQLLYRCLQPGQLQLQLRLVALTGLVQGLLQLSGLLGEGLLARQTCAALQRLQTMQQVERGLQIALQLADQCGAGLQQLAGFLDEHAEHAGHRRLWLRGNRRFGRGRLLRCRFGQLGRTLRR